MLSNRKLQKFAMFAIRTAKRILAWIEHIIIRTSQITLDVTLAKLDRVNTVMVRLINERPGNCHVAVMVLPDFSNNERWLAFANVPVAYFDFLYFLHHIVKLNYAITHLFLGLY